MNLNGRIEKLESKLMPGNGVHVINPNNGETEEQATQRYCAENGITIEELYNPKSLVVFLNTHFPD